MTIGSAAMISPRRSGVTATCASCSHRRKRAWRARDACALPLAVPSGSGAKQLPAAPRSPHGLEKGPVSSASPGPSQVLALKAGLIHRTEYTCEPITTAGGDERSRRVEPGTHVPPKKHGLHHPAGELVRFGSRSATTSRQTQTQTLWMRPHLGFITRADITPSRYPPSRLRPPRPPRAFASTSPACHCLTIS
jgi:hypothetical protein